MASFPEFWYNSFFSIYFLASFRQQFNVLNNILASFVLFYVSFKPLSLECSRTISLFVPIRPSRRSPATMCRQQDHHYRLSHVREVVKWKIQETAIQLVEVDSRLRGNDDTRDAHPEGRQFRRSLSSAKAGERESTARAGPVCESQCGKCERTTPRHREAIMGISSEATKTGPRQECSILHRQDN